MTNEEGIKYLKFLVSNYDSVTETITKVKLRGQALLGIDWEEDFDGMLKGQGKAEGLDTVKGRMTREIDKELKKWDIWETWAKAVPGIGPFIAAKMIILFYYRFIAVCKDCGGRLEKQEKVTEKGKTINALVCDDCGKTAKDGLLTHKLEFKDFPTISKWWAYMGMHTVDGVKPKRAKGVVSNWSTEGRTLCFHIGDQFNRQKDDHPYKALLNERKAKHQRNHPEWSKGHVHNAAKNEVAKIFLAHWWTVARIIEGKEVSEPYAGALMGHTNIIKPFYWEEESDGQHETHSSLATSHQQEARV